MSDIIFWFCVAVALYYVPRYLWRVYGGPSVGAMIVNGFNFVMSLVSRPSYADETDRPADRLSVSAEFDRAPRWEVDKTRTAVIEELLYSGWTITDLRREGILRGDNTKISAEVEAARQRLGIEAPDNRTPIANRPTPAKFASDAGR